MLRMMMGRGVRVHRHGAAAPALQHGLGAFGNGLAQFRVNKWIERRMDPLWEKGNSGRVMEGKEGGEGCKRTGPDYERRRTEKGVFCEPSQCCCGLQLHCIPSSGHPLFSGRTLLPRAVSLTSCCNSGGDRRHGRHPRAAGPWCLAVRSPDEPGRDVWRLLPCVR